MRWSILLPCLLAVNPTSALYNRDYDSHDYYAVHLRPQADPQDVSNHLGLHYEGPLGELQDHHIFRTTSRQLDFDHVQSAIDDLKLKRRKREAGAELPHVLDHVLLSQKQELEKRFPRVKRQLPTSLSQLLPKPDEAEVQKGEEVAQTLGIQDPMFQEQWHLHNSLQLGHDINVTGVWLQGVTGKNTTVCFVDDGLDMDSDDLRDNYFAAGSWDFNDNVPDPKPRLADDRHGTRCAGEVAAVRNDVCGVGIAYDGKVSGLRILSKVISDADEAIAMTYAFQENQIYSCSWGPPDDGQSMEKPGLLIQRSMLNGVQRGRGGRGSIYVFAIGNGASNDDNCNFDGYTNSIYSVSVGGIDRQGKHPYYSEACSAQLVVTYSSGAGDAIHTTDVGKDACYANHGGTSAAGPLVAGMYALMLEVNPALTWRDIQWITVLTAVKVNETADWTMNEAVKKEFSHQFGFGKADAYALVEMARNWTNVKPQAWFFSPWQVVNHDIPQGDQGLAAHFTVTEDMLKEANLERLEHVTVTMNVQHTRRGDLSVELRSPSGMVSHIATARRNDNAAEGYIDWTFMSVAHWGESGIGEWTVIVKDTKENDNTGSFTDWRLRLWGESIDAEKQQLLPMMTEHDDDHMEETTTETASVKTTSITVPTETGTPTGNPDDHIDRPVNVKTSASTEPTQTAPIESTDTPSPTNPADDLPVGSDVLPEATETPGTPSDMQDNEETDPEADMEDATNPEESQDEDLTGEKEADENDSSSSNFLPHPFPTFGVSKTTQVWIYGAIVLILTFLVGLGAWWWYMRRKQRWMNRDDYGFEMVDHDDHEEDETSGFVNGRRRRKKRAGELYDAFAEGTDDEDGEPFELGEDSDQEVDAHDEKRYRDTETSKEGTDAK